jgi:hypothetical protein
LVYASGEIDVCEKRFIVLFWWLVVPRALDMLGSWYKLVNFGAEKILASPKF